MKRISLSRGPWILTLVLAAGCSNDEDTKPAGQNDSREPFTLQLLHFADIDGNEATALDNLDAFSALVQGLRSEGNTLIVSSGDNLIPGPRWFAPENDAIADLIGSDEPGSLDHYLMNQFGVAASALGNHDLDQGPGELADAIAQEVDNVREPYTSFPYLAANVDFGGHSDFTVAEGGNDYRQLGGQVAPSATATFENEVIGLVGVSTPDLPSITATGNLNIAGSTDDLATLAAAIQPAVDALTDAGINKIVLLSHLQQIDLEKALAKELSDVDIIVAGGSNTRMGNPNNPLYPGDESFTEDYPFETTDADESPVLIVNTDGDYKYLGRLVVSFDENGIVIPDSIDPAESGPWAATEANVTAANGSVLPEVAAVQAAVQDVIKVQYENIVGHTAVFLEGRRNLVRTEETNLGNLTADAMKWYAEQCAELNGTSVIAIKNGGGIRAEMGNVIVEGTNTTLKPPSNAGLEVNPGDISEGHLRGTLRFDNGLVALKVTGPELKSLLERGVAAWAPGVTAGTFPQVAGISFGFTPDGTAQEVNIVDDEVVGITTPGERVTDIYVDSTGDGAPNIAVYTSEDGFIDEDRIYTLITLNFLANGGDDYPFALISAPNRTQLYPSILFGDPDSDENEEPDFPVLTGCDPGAQTHFSDSGQEQDVVAEYLLTRFPSANSAFDSGETAAADDRRIQNLRFIEGGAFIPPDGF